MLICVIALILVGGFGTRLRPLVRRPAPRPVSDCTITLHATTFRRKYKHNG